MLPDDANQQLRLGSGLKRAADSTAATDKRQRVEQEQTTLSSPRIADTCSDPSSVTGSETSERFSLGDRLSPRETQASNLGNLGDFSHIQNPFDAPADGIDNSPLMIHPLSVLDSTTYHLGTFADFPGHYNSGSVRAESDVFDSLCLLSQGQDTHALFHLGRVADFPAGNGLEIHGTEVPCASADHTQLQMDDGSHVGNEYLDLGTIVDFASAGNLNIDIHTQPQPCAHPTSSHDPGRHGQPGGYENGLELSSSGAALGFFGGASEQSSNAIRHVSEGREVRSSEYTLEHFESAFPFTMFQCSVVA